MPITERPPTDLELQARIWAALHLAIHFPFPESIWGERVRRAKRSLFIRHLVKTGRLNGPISES